MKRNPGKTLSLLLLLALLLTAALTHASVREDKSEQPVSRFDALEEAIETRTARKAVAVSVSFKEVLPDSQIISFLHTYQALPYAVFYLTGDLYGSYRIDRSGASLNVIQEARRSVVGLRDKARAGTQARARSLIAANSPAEFSSNPVLVERGRSLVLRSAIDDVTQMKAIEGAPFVYGLHVVLDSRKAQLLLGDPHVMAELETITLTKAGLRPVLSSPHAPVEDVPDLQRSAQSLSGADVYRVLQKMTVRDRKQEVLNAK